VTSSGPSGTGVGDPPRVPWEIRTIRWVSLPIMLVPLVFMMVYLVLPAVLPEKPRDVPGDVCALVPADLLARVVPAAGPRETEAKNGEQYTNRARCSVSTQPDLATSTARGILTIELNRHGDLAGRNPADHAQNEFALTKRYLFGREGTRVYDLSKLGDSAYLAVDRSGDSDHRVGPLRVSVAVLRKDIELTVRYSASPTDDRLASAAAVAVARAVLGGVR
jgi:hypothetical protein